MVVHVFTSVTCNYIPKARVLAESVKRIHPEFRFHLVLADVIPSWFRLETEPFDELIAVEDLGIRNAEQWLFKHTLVEACTGVKGPALVRLLSNQECGAVLYFDPDIVVLSRLDELIAQLETASVLLTPHLTEPEKTLTAILDNEFSVLQHGIYNLGFLGVRRSNDGLAFARWWADRLEEFCYDEIPRGLFTDQRWADLAPAFFEGVRVLRDPQYNVCTWNLTHRRVSGSFESGFTVNGRPLAFYHFSGFDGGAQKAMLDRYGAGMPALYNLRDWYVAECGRKGQDQLASVAWVYGLFDDGRPISKLHRKLYRERSDLQSAFPNPFATAGEDGSYRDWFDRNQSKHACRGSELPDMPSPVPSPYPSPTAADPEYRVFVSLCETDAATAARCVKEIHRRTFRKDRITLIGSEENVRPFEHGQDIDAQIVSLPAGASHEDAFGAVAERLAREMDFVFTVWSVVVPDLWDLRLAWTAGLLPGVATVSPLNDAFEHGALDLTGNPSELDALCYANSLLANPEAPGFFDGCFFVNHRAFLEAPAKVRQEFRARASGLRWSHVVADHIYTGNAAERKAALHAEPPPAVKSLGQQLQSGAATSSDPATRAVRRQLHIVHSWGGGLERWVQEFGASSTHENFVLKSFGGWGTFGQEIRLFRTAVDATPIRRWAMTPGIKGSTSVHTAYRAALSEIVRDYGIDAVLVSSLIGHSLDVFRTGLRTLMVCHDYYPFCPALNITFNTVCNRCDGPRLAECTLENPHNRFFPNVPPGEWIGLRKEFRDAITVNGVRLIAPSESLREMYTVLVPELAPHFHVIPHGVPLLNGGPLKLAFAGRRRLRIVILGSLAPHKGEALLKAILPRLLEFADVHLMGCGDWGPRFARPGVTIVPQYALSELGDILRSIGPDLGLLLSVVPESFSYTLQELFEFAIPPVATRLGSFADRIRDAENGFLVNPDADSVLERLRTLSENRAALQKVHRRLAAEPPRHIDEMLADYESAIGLGALSARAYFAPEQRSLSPADAAMSLAWRNEGSAVNEESAVRFHVPVSDAPHTVCVRAPRDASIASLRLELDPMAAAVALYRIQLVDEQAEPLWSWSSSEGPLHPPGVHNVVWLGGSPGALIYVLGHDPHVELPIDGALLERAGPRGRLEIELSFPQIAEMVARMSAALAQNGQIRLRETELESLRQYLAEKSAGRKTDREIQSDGLLDELEAAWVRVTELEASLSWRITKPLRKGADVVLKVLGGSR